MKIIVSHTILRIEALIYEEALFSDYVQVGNAGGWKLVFSRDFENTIKSSEVLKFIDDVKEILKKTDGYGYSDFDSAHVATSLFTRYRCTIDEKKIGFIIKTKTSIKVDEAEEKKKSGFFLFRFFRFCFGCFKKVYNGFLDFLKIG